MRLTEMESESSVMGWCQTMVAKPSQARYYDWRCGWILWKTGMCSTRRLLVTEELEVIKLDVIEAFPDEIEELDKDKLFVEPAWGVKSKNRVGVTTKRRPKTKDLRCKTLVCLPLLGVIILEIRITWLQSWVASGNCGPSFQIGML